jgi:hypothetical protein
MKRFALLAQVTALLSGRLIIFAVENLFVIQ